mmetsp:Transcript_331/g.486  ORF Transcript_331/g.486 Transcript_331/m.486 type:complete len:136 (-) Transcript_331:148-555(-)
MTYLVQCANIPTEYGGQSRWMLDVNQPPIFFEEYRIPSSIWTEFANGMNEIEEKNSKTSCCDNIASFIIWAPLAPYVLYVFIQNKRSIDQFLNYWNESTFGDFGLNVQSKVCCLPGGNNGPPYELLFEATGTVHP